MPDGRGAREPQPYGSDPDEDLAAPASSWPRWVALVAVLAVAVAVGVLVGRSSSGASDTPRAAATTVTRAVTVPPSSTSSSSTAASPTIPFGDTAELRTTGLFSSSASVGSRTITYAFDLGNDATTALTVRYPIRLIASNGLAIDDVTAGFYDVDVARAHRDDINLPPHRLTRIAANGLVALVVRIRVGCMPSETVTSAQQQPSLQVHFTQYRQPTTFPLADLGGGFFDFVRQVCGT